MSSFVRSRNRVTAVQCEILSASLGPYRVRDPPDWCIQEFVRAGICPESGAAAQARRATTPGGSLAAGSGAVLAEMACPHLPDLWLLRYVHQRGKATSLGRALPAMRQSRAPQTDAALDSGRWRQQA